MFLAMNVPHARQQKFSLSMAGLGVEVFCNDARLARRLRQRYRAFSTETDVRLTADIHWQPQGRSHPVSQFRERIYFDNDVVRLEFPDCDGLIHPSMGSAELRLSSFEPIAAVDYFLRVVYAYLALHNGGLLFHGAGIVRNGAGHVFFGKSGSGKTTVARLSPEAVVLNDDLVLLMPSPKGWRVHATPFWNPTQVTFSGNRSAPLVALFRLVQDRGVSLKAMNPGQTLAELVAGVLVVANKQTWLQALVGRCLALLGSVPVWNLHFLPDSSFWQVIDTLRFDDTSPIRAKAGRPVG